jgi:hypothetical protein
MEIQESRNRLRADLRSVARENDDVVVSGKGVGGNHEGVAGATLLRLEYELDPGVGDRRADTVGFVADDDKHILRRNETAGRSNHVRQQRLSANFMQHFGQLRFEARTFSGSHDGNCDAGRG